MLVERFVLTEIKTIIVIIIIIINLPSGVTNVGVTRPAVTDGVTLLTAKD